MDINRTMREIANEDRKDEAGLTCFCLGRPLGSSLMLRQHARQNDVARSSGSDGTEEPLTAAG